MGDRRATLGLVTVLRPIDPDGPRHQVVVTRVPTTRTEPDADPGREDPGSWPPIDFPVLGLDGSWEGPRWLESVDGVIGELAPRIWLAHGDRPGPVRGHPWILVATARPSGIPWADHPGMVLERELAWSGLYRLMHSVTPYLEDRDHRRRYARNFAPYLLTRASRCESWAPARWTIGTKTTTARFARLAGAWTGWAFELDKFAVTVVASGVSPHDIRLRRISSARPYHFDVRAPISYPQTLDTARDQALGPRAADDPRPHRLHSDIRKLIYNDRLKLPPGYAVA